MDNLTQTERETLERTWALDGREKSWGIIGPDGRTLGLVFKDGANATFVARLAVAAPALLEALVRVSDWDDGVNPAGYAGLGKGLRAAVDAAIALATLTGEAA